MTTPAKPLTADEIADLKAKAKVATPGPWELKKKHEGVIWHWYAVHDGAQIAEISSWNLDRNKSARYQAAANADLIIAANPETVLSLIATIEQQAEQIEKLRAGLSYHGAHDVGCAGGEYCTCGYTEALAATEPVNDKR